MKGCKFQQGNEVECYELCLAARLSGEDRICAGSTVDPIYAETMKALMSEPIYADEQQREDDLTYRLERDEELRQAQPWKFED